MFGYVIFNNSNTVVFLDGDNQFKKSFQKIIHNDIRTPNNENTSSSSGIYTDSCEETEEFRIKRKKSDIIFDFTKVTHILLPLIVLYKSGNERNNDEFNCITSPFGNITITRIYGNHILIAFSNNSLNRKHLLKLVEQTIIILFGPLISFCNTNLSTVKRPKEILSQILYRQPCISNSEFIDIRRKLFYYPLISKFSDILANISSQLSVFIGNNRCALLCHNDIIATYNSIDGSQDILKGVNCSDLLGIISNCSSFNKVQQIEQYWLRSNHGLIPYYVNAISYRLSSNISIVCISEANENVIIRYLCLFTKQIERLRNTNDLNRDLREIRKTINDLQILFKCMKPVNENIFVSFMKNPSRALTFLKSIWEQIETEVKKINSIPGDNLRTESRFSISSLRSAISSISLTSSIFSKISITEQSISKKLDVLLSYAKRQTNAFIQELCFITINITNKHTFLLFNQCMEKVLKRNVLKYLENSKIGDSISESCFEKYLKPSEYYLEMMAYRIEFKELRQEIVYIEDKSLDDVADLLKTQKFKSSSCNYRFNNGSYATIQCCFFPKKYSRKRNAGILSTTDITITAIFPEYINKNLAEKQTNKLLNCILSEM